MSSELSSESVKEGDFVIAKTETALRVIQVWKDRPLFLGKRKIHICSTIGHPYSSFFEIKGNGSLKVQPHQFFSEFSFQTTVDDTDKKDNRSLVNTGSSQKLTTDDIEAFKAEGIPGDEIVKIIVENSSSFKEKSVYSQEKYLKKKQQKYINFIQVLKPNTRLLVETYYLQHPQKIYNLRIDSLSQMLTFCNVLSGGKYIVVDSVLGLLTAAVLERLGTRGFIIQVHMGPVPITTYRQAVNALNLSQDHLQTMIYSIDFRKAIAVFQPVEHAQNVEDSVTDNAKEDISNDDDNVDGIITEVDSKKLAIDQKRQEVIRQRLEKKIHLEKTKEMLSHKDLDGLLIAIKHHPLDVLPLLDFLSYSRPFAIYSMHQQPLIDCYVSLKSRGDIILLNISETWLRKYQVLPERTHPDYTMFGNGGFLLTGIKVEKKNCA